MEINHRYKVWVSKENEIPVLTYVKEQKIGGYMYPNMKTGTLFELHMTPDMIVVMRLKFSCKVECVDET